MDRPVGSVTYTPFLDERGGIVADVTVSRLAEDRFRVVTGAGFVASDLAWLRSHAATIDRLPPVVLRDVSDELATIGLWGPHARDILAAAARDDVGDAAIPLRQARSIGVAGASVLAARISYAGELGWELSMPAEDAVAVWDALGAAGRPYGLEPFGYRALDALRIEKGYRYYSVDMTMLDSPDEAGLGAFVRRGDGDYVGRDGLAARRAAEAGDAAGSARRLRTLRIGDGPGYLALYGGEAVRNGGGVISRLRSVAYGPTVEATIGYAYMPIETPEGATVEVEVFDDRVTATVVADALVDPDGSRMRG
jgi:glycine cleavage system aminomethyltransferase T